MLTQEDKACMLTSQMVLCLVIPCRSLPRLGRIIGPAGERAVGGGAFLPGASGSRVGRTCRVPPELGANWARERWAALRQSLKPAEFDWIGARARAGFFARSNIRRRSIGNGS